MDFIAQNDDNDREEFTDHSLPVDFVDKSHIDGDPIVLPRIGEEYQAELPPLPSKAECWQLRSAGGNQKVDIDFNSRKELDIPVFWVPCQSSDIEEEKRKPFDSHISPDQFGLAARDNIKRCHSLHGNLETSLGAETSSSRPSKLPVRRGRFVKVELPDEVSGTVTRPERSKSTSLADAMQMKLPDLGQGKPFAYSPLPGSQSVSWSSVEVENFLLCLYIFNKNLVHVRKFLESKTMGDILSFYYGKFCKSRSYRRWSECRKSRSIKCIFGQRIFTGRRQQELLSRLLPCISAERHDDLLKVTKTFSEGETCFEEYIFTIKDIVGIKALVQAVGIGTGKRDLTGISLDHARGNRAVIIPSEIPSGKGCSSLTTGEIVKFLTGNFRLSKTRSNDLFWEAVWPRLLAKGWHSEQPKDLGYAPPRHSLVFLVPGVKKFSRSRLVKGEHYYDSVSDVLSKVSSDPTLLDLEAQGDGGSVDFKNDIGSDSDGSSDDKVEPDHQNHNYLQPKLPNCTSDLMKFTVVDTSLVRSDGTRKVKEIRNLPSDGDHIHNLTSSSDEMDIRSSQTCSLAAQEDTYQNMSHRKMAKNIAHTVHQKTQPVLSSNVVRSSKHEISIGKQIANGQHHSISNRQNVNDLGYLFCRGENSSKSNYLSPVPKRRRLINCNGSESTRPSHLMSKGQCLKKEARRRQKLPDASHSVAEELTTAGVSSKGSSPLKTSISSSCGSDLNHKNHGQSTVHDMPSSNGKLQQRELFDLNVPQFSPEIDATEQFGVEISKKADNLNLDRSSQPHSDQRVDESWGPETSNGLADEPQNDVNERRHSSRNRPLTAKALEALASGFVTTKKRRPLRAPFCAPRSSRSSRKIAQASVSHSTRNNDGFAPKIGSRADEECSSYADDSSLFNLQVEQETNRVAYEVLGLKNLL